MKSIIAIGDVHGCYATLMALLSKLPKDVPLVMLGDLIDRGPKNRDVINWVRQNNIPCVVGNHEAMMASHSFSQRQTWMMNGGRQTYKEYEEDKEAFRSDIQWINNLPWYIEFPDIKNSEGRYLVVSHTTIANYWSKRDTTDFFEAVWDRKSIPKSIRGVYNIYGHTPIKKPLIREYFANIDTGCVYGSSYNLGRLTALQFPEMIVYQQECLDFNLDQKGISNLK